MNGTLVQTELASRALEGNPLGDAALRTLTVYLPPDYAHSGRRYPTAYFLHAFMGSGAGWTQGSVFSPSVPERLDALVAGGALPPFIGVFPDGATRLGGTQWNNTPAIGRYQDYVADEVVALCDSRFRTVARPEGRAALGRSSGGYGALRLGHDRPDVFAHVASNAGDAFFEYCYLPDFPKAAGSFLKAGGYEPWYRDFLDRARKTKMRGDDHAALNVLAMAASYSPKAGAPLGLELPFDAETARPLEHVLDRWRTQDPVRFVETGKDSFRRLRSVVLECGARDEYNMRWGTRMVARALQGLGVRVVHEEFDDGHSGTSYRFDRTLSLLLPGMANE